MDINLRPLRLKLYDPKLNFYRDDLDPSDIDILDNTSGSFHCRYKIPNALIPQLQSRVILTTKELIYRTSVYDEGAVINFNNITQIKEKGGLLEVQIENKIIEVQITNPLGREFSELVIDTWKKEIGKIEEIDKDAERIVTEIERLEEQDSE